MCLSLPQYIIMLVFILYFPINSLTSRKGFPMLIRSYIEVISVICLIFGSSIGSMFPRKMTAWISYSESGNEYFWDWKEWLIVQLCLDKWNLHQQNCGSSIRYDLVTYERFNKITNQINKLAPSIINLFFDYAKMIVFLNILLSCQPFIFYA